MLDARICRVYVYCRRTLEKAKMQSLSGGRVYVNA
jgi:hypothetical protein